MSRQKTILILSDIHYASDAEKRRRGHEARIIANPLLRRAVKVYRHYIWLRDPFAHNHLLDEFLQKAKPAYEGSIVYGMGQGHSWEALSEAEMMQAMAKAMAAKR